ncbi:hypothetical protein J6590_060324 [Homalodisca vitripennis]|nr:hypothetical protein J6590_060324 [Homalodisca vitripennis]
MAILVGLEGNTLSDILVPSSQYITQVFTRLVERGSVHKDRSELEEAAEVLPNIAILSLCLSGKIRLWLIRTSCPNFLKLF